MLSEGAQIERASPTYRDDVLIVVRGGFSSCECGSSSGGQPRGFRATVFPFTPRVAARGTSSELPSHACCDCNAQEARGVGPHRAIQAPHETRAYPYDPLSVATYTAAAAATEANYIFKTKQGGNTNGAIKRNILWYASHICFCQPSDPTSSLSVCARTSRTKRGVHTWEGVCHRASRRENRGFDNSVRI